MVDMPWHWGKFLEGSVYNPYFWRKTNFLIIQYRRSQEKSLCQNQFNMLSHFDTLLACDWKEQRAVFSSPRKFGWTRCLQCSFHILSNCLPWFIWNGKQWSQWSSGSMSVWLVWEDREQRVTKDSRVYLDDQCWMQPLLCTFTAMPRSTQPSALHETVK